MKRILPVLIGWRCSTVHSLGAGEGPFFVTYSHQMEEPGNLEITTKNITGKPGDGNRFLGSALEFEYGLKGWWTTEVYLDGQATGSDSTIFSPATAGRTVSDCCRANTGSTRSCTWNLKTSTGLTRPCLKWSARTARTILPGRNSEARAEKQREIEAKLILGSYFKGWTIAENFIAEKNVTPCAV